MVSQQDVAAGVSQLPSLPAKSGSQHDGESSLLAVGSSTDDAKIESTPAQDSIPTRKSLTTGSSAAVAESSGSSFASHPVGYTMSKSSPSASTSSSGSQQETSQSSRTGGPRNRKGDILVSYASSKPSDTTNPSSSLETPEAASFSLKFAAKKADAAVSSPSAGAGEKDSRVSTTGSAAPASAVSSSSIKRGTRKSADLVNIVRELEPGETASSGTGGYPSSSASSRIASSSFIEANDGVLSSGEIKVISQKIYKDTLILAGDSCQNSPAKTTIDVPREMSWFQKLSITGKAEAIVNLVTAVRTKWGGNGGFRKKTNEKLSTSLPPRIAAMFNDLFKKLGARWGYTFTDSAGDLATVAGRYITDWETVRNPVQLEDLKNKAVLAFRGDLSISDPLKTTGTQQSSLIEKGAALHEPKQTFYDGMRSAAEPFHAENVVDETVRDDATKGTSANDKDSERTNDGASVVDDAGGAGHSEKATTNTMPVGSPTSPTVLPQTSSHLSAEIDGSSSAIEVGVVLRGQQQESTKMTQHPGHDAVTTLAFPPTPSSAVPEPSPASAQSSDSSTSASRLLEGAVEKVPQLDPAEVVGGSSTTKGEHDEIDDHGVPVQEDPSSNLMMREERTTEMTKKKLSSDPTGNVSNARGTTSTGNPSAIDIQFQTSAGAVGPSFSMAKTPGETRAAVRPQSTTSSGLRGNQHEELFSSVPGGKVAQILEENVATPGHPPSQSTTCFDIFTVYLSDVYQFLSAIGEYFCNQVRNFCTSFLVFLRFDHRFEEGHRMLLFLIVAVTACLIAGYLLSRWWRRRKELELQALEKAVRDIENNLGSAGNDDSAGASEDHRAEESNLQLPHADSKLVANLLILDHEILAAARPAAENEMRPANRLINGITDGAVKILEYGTFVKETSMRLNIWKRNWGLGPADWEDEADESEDEEGF
ncbi:unnamed protein product [Amoebophrya sp. A120]|nr:unnamed protein product [Amoebophrya sp. A120]|eukprot:GSA120T00021312001.1